MKGALFFNLPEEQEQFEDASNAGGCRAALDHIAMNIFRKRRKYKELTDDQTRLVVEMEKEFYEILSDRNVNI